MDKSPPGAQADNVTSSQSVTEIITEPVDVSSQEPVLRLRLHKPKVEKKVSWTNTTIDNEEMNKKKSKCCCIYKKPPVFGESSSESDDECEHCYGHVEHRKKNKKSSDHHNHEHHHHHDHDHHNNDNAIETDEAGASSPRTATIVESPKQEEIEPAASDPINPENKPDINPDAKSNDEN